MINRIVALLGLSLVLVAGTFALAQHLTVGQVQPPAASEATEAPAQTPAPSAAPVPPSSVPEPATPAQPVAPPVVVAPPAVATPPVAVTPPPEKVAPVVTAPRTSEPAPAVATPAPLPPEKPAITEKNGLPARQLFAAKQLPSLGKAMAIGYYPRGCLAGGVSLPVTGPTWQVMRLSRNRNWGHPSLVRFLERFAPQAAKATGWKGILVGDMAQPRGGPLPFGHTSHQIGLDVDIWFMPMPGHVLDKDEREKTSAISLVADDGKHVNPKTWTPQHIDFIRTAAEQPEVERVLVNAAIKKEICRAKNGQHPSWLAKVRPWYAHQDHIHVRLKCPADSPNCRHQPPVPSDDGCNAAALDYWFSDKVLHPKPRPPGGPSPHPLTMADLPPACQTVLSAPAREPIQTTGR